MRYCLGVSLFCVFACLCVCLVVRWLVCLCLFVCCVVLLCCCCLGCDVDVMRCCVVWFLCCALSCCLFVVWLV